MTLPELSRSEVADSRTSTTEPSLATNCRGTSSSEPVAKKAGNPSSRAKRLDSSVMNSVDGVTEHLVRARTRGAAASGR